MSTKISTLVAQPSNIALIKYMGKENVENNVPANASLSFTLPHLKSFVRVTVQPGTKTDLWKPLTDEPGANAPVELSEKAKTRFLKHLAFLKQTFGVEQGLLVESANNFPSDCGIASSASSFAALTKAAIETFQALGVKQAYCSEGDMAALSAKGSGSSCRSFFGPWVLWSGNTVRPIEFPYENLYHQVIVVDGAKKSVSSSEAHKRVMTSALYNHRPNRAQDRLAHLLEALRHQDWQKCYQICWEEFWDMHSLFETSNPSFGYFGEKTVALLNELRNQWDQTKDGPIVTTDAGPNVHLLWRPDQISAAKAAVKKFEQFGRVIGSDSVL
jgi:diphosphomevalonate decarboxylase